MTCPKCGRYPVPTGYAWCRSCTFGWDSREGRLSRAYLGASPGARMSMAAKEIAAATRGELWNPAWEDVSDAVD